MQSTRLPAESPNKKLRSTSSTHFKGTPVGNREQPRLERPAQTADTTRTVVWRADEGPCCNLAEMRRRWTEAGWTVRRCEPRILDGETCGALLVLKKRRSLAHESERREPDRRHMIDDRRSSSRSLSTS